MFGIFKKGIKETIEDNLVDEKENKGLVFILILAIIGILAMVSYVSQSYVSTPRGQVSYIYSLMATLFFVSGGAFTFSNLVGFLFGIPRATIIESEKSKSQYIGNDNLLQVSDWITKIILGLGLTQIHEIPHLLKRIAGFITNNTHVSNQALIILIILYFSCIGFLFGYLWTRLYFIKMLRDSDSDVNGDATATAHLKTEITTDIKTDVVKGEEKK